MANIVQLGSNTRKSVFLDSLLNSNPNIFAQRNSESVRNLILYQFQKICYNILQTFGLFAHNSWESIAWKIPLNIPIKSRIFDYLFLLANQEHKPILDLWCLKSKWVHLFRCQMLICETTLRSPMSESTCSKVVEVSENINNIIVPYAGLHFIDSDYELSEERVLKEFNDTSIWFAEKDSIDLESNKPDSLIELKKLENRYANLLQIIYPTPGCSIENFNKKMLEISYMILNTADTQVNDNKSIINIEIAATMFANYLRSSIPFNYSDTDMILQLSLGLLKYTNHPQILALACFAIRNLSGTPTYPEFLVHTEKCLPILFSFISSESSNLVKWASRCIATIYTNTIINKPMDLNKILDFFSNESQDVASWAISFIGTLVKKAIYNDSKSESIINIYIDLSNVVPIIFSLLNNRSRCVKVVEACLWCLGNFLATNIKFFDQTLSITGHPEITNFLNLKLFTDPNFGPHAEKIILFACRCIDLLTSKKGIYRYTMDDMVLSKIVGLINDKQQKISVWALCFLGILCDNKESYNTNVVNTILNSYLASIISQINTDDSKILEATLWTIRKIASSHSTIIPKINTILNQLNPHHRIIHLFHHTDPTIVESAYLCFSIISTQEQFKIGIPKIINTLKHSSGDISNTTKVALCCLNTAVSNKCEHMKLNRKLFGKEEQMILIKFLRIPKLTETICWLLGNLVLRKKYRKFICNLIISDIVEFLKCSDLLIAEGAAFLFCNLFIESVPCCLHIDPLPGSNQDISPCLTNPPTCNFSIDGYDNIVLFIHSMLKKQENNTYRCGSKILEACCWAIHKIASNEKYLQLILEYDVLRDIMSLFFEYQSNNIINDDVIKGACWALGKLVINKNYVQVACDIGLIEQSVKLLGHTSENIQALTSRYLGTMVVKNVDNTDILCHIGKLCIPKLFECLLSKKLPLVEICSWCLANLMTRHENKILLINQPNFNFDLMNEFLTYQHERTVEAITIILKHLSKGIPNYKSELAKISIETLIKNISSNTLPTSSKANMIYILLNLSQDRNLEWQIKNYIDVFTEYIYDPCLMLRTAALEICLFFRKRKIIHEKN